MAERASSATKNKSDTNTEDLTKLSRPARWMLAIRPKTLSLSVVPVLAGAWIAAQSGFLQVGILAVTLLAAVAIQVGTNLWNDAADASLGTDGPDRLGPPRVTALGLLTAEHVRIAAMLAFLVAAALGLYLTMLGGWPIALLGIVSLALGFCYSMGPYPLSHTPMGEVLVIAFFGIAAVTGTAYLHGLEPNGRVLLLGFAIGLPAAAVLLVNNHRDRQQDAHSGRRTLAMLIGVRASRALYTGLLLSSLFVGAFFAQPCTLGLLAFGPAIALAGYLAWEMTNQPISPQLNRLILGTSAFQVLIFLAVVAPTVLCSTGAEGS